MRGKGAKRGGMARGKKGRKEDITKGKRGRNRRERVLENRKGIRRKDERPERMAEKRASQEETA